MQIDWIFADDTEIGRVDVDTMLDDQDYDFMSSDDFWDAHMLAQPTNRKQRRQENRKNKGHKNG